MTQSPKERHNDEKRTTKGTTAKELKKQLKGKIRIRMANCHNNGKMTNIAGIANAVICPTWL